MQIKDKEIIEIINILYDEGIFKGITIDFKQIIEALQKHNMLLSLEKCPNCAFSLFNIEENIDIVKCCNCNNMVKIKRKIN